MADRSAEFAVETSTFARGFYQPLPRSAIFSTIACPMGIGLSSNRPEDQRLWQLVNFDQTYPRSTTVARQNSGVASGSDCCKNRRLQIIRRRQSGCLNFHLLRVLPII